jgi:hypothetical protein
MPGDGLADRAGVVSAGVGRQVGRIHRDDRHLLPDGGGAASCAQHEGAGQMHQVGLVLRDNGTDPAARHTNTEAGVNRQADRRNADYGKAVVVIG